MLELFSVEPANAYGRSEGRKNCMDGRVVACSFVAPKVW